MACSKCGGSRADPITGLRNVVAANVSTNDDGWYRLATYSTSVAPYTGQFRGESAFVLGIGTKNERLFRRRQRTEAIAAAREISATLDQYAVAQLPHEAVVDLLGA